MGLLVLAIAFAGCAQTIPAAPGQEVTCTTPTLADQWQHCDYAPPTEQQAPCVLPSYTAVTGDITLCPAAGWHAAGNLPPDVISVYVGNDDAVLAFEGVGTTCANATAKDLAVCIVAQRHAAQPQCSRAAAIGLHGAWQLCEAGGQATDGWSMLTWICPRTVGKLAITLTGHAAADPDVVRQAAAMVQSVRFAGNACLA